MTTHPYATPHPYMAAVRNGVPVFDSCLKCGLPKHDTRVHTPPEPPKPQPEQLTIAVLVDVEQERRRQDGKFGSQTHLTDLFWLGIEGEEFAELSQRFAQAARLVLHPDEQLERDQLEEVVKALRAELVQVSAVAVAWIEAIDTRKPAATSR